MKLVNQKITTKSGFDFYFDIESFDKMCLLNGLDDIGWTLKFKKKINDFENYRRITSPWLFLNE